MITFEMTNYFDSQLAKLHFWPKIGQWDPIGTQYDPICINFDPNWVKLEPNGPKLYIHKLPINRPSGCYVMSQCLEIDMLGGVMGVKWWGSWSTN